MAARQDANKQRAAEYITGRPSLYDPVYCDLVVDVCSEGYSLTGFAGHIGVDRFSITRWTEEFPEFSAAVTRAKALRTRWWEDRSRQVAKDGGPGGQATMVIFGLKNHAPEDYSDKQQHEHYGKDGKDLIPAQHSEEKLALVLLNLLHSAKAKREGET